MKRRSLPAPRWVEAHRVAAALLALVAAAQAAATEIPLVREGGVYSIPVRINGVITLDFIIDSGAAEVMLPLVRAKTIGRGDFLPGRTYSLADDSTVKSNRFVIRELTFGDRLVTNVPAMIGSVAGPLLLGQSLLERLPAWSLDNRRHVLIVGEGEARPAETQSVPDEEETAESLLAAGCKTRCGRLRSCDTSDPMSGRLL
jgi:predicted aspartyl protease